MRPGGRPPHVLFINEFYYPDVCASSAVLTDHLPKLAGLRPDWRLSVVAGDCAWDRPRVRWPAFERHGPIEVQRVARGAVRRSLWGRGAGFVRFHRSAARRGCTLDPVDLVVASTAPPFGARIGLAIAEHHRCPMIYKVLDLYPDCAAALGVISAGGLVMRGWRRLDTHAMRRAAAVVAISERMAQRIRDTRRVEAERLHHIPDGFDPDRLATADPTEFRRAGGLEGKFIVQYAGNMGLSHPMETILAAADALAAEDDIIFQFIGGGPARPVIERAIAAGGPNLRLHDYQPAERLGDVLHAADVALISQAPAMADLALPYKVYGILAAGRPGIFIGSARSEIVEWYRAADCGLHIEQGDVAGLVAAIRGLRSDPKRAAALGRHGRDLLNRRFRSDEAVRRWANLIESVLTGRRPSARLA